MFTLLAILFATPAHAATRSDVEAAIGYMFGRTLSPHYIEPVKSRISAPGVSSSQIVFVTGGQVYTMHYALDSNSQQGVLTYYQRPIGTHDQDSLSAYYDSAIDGLVDWGGGYGGGTFNGAITPAIGEAIRVHWQAEYDAAIQATLAYFRAPP